MRKFISILSAASIAATSFAAVITAQADGEKVLWSDNFNSYENNVEPHPNLSALGMVLADGTLTARTESNAIPGVTLYTTNRGDDSSYFMVVDDGNGGKALETTTSRFANAGRGSSIEFATAYAPTDDEDLVLAFKVKIANDGGTTYDEAIIINGDNTNKIELVDDLGIELGEWADVKVVITASGASVYANDATDPAVTLSGVKNLTSIKFNALVGGVEAGGDQKAASHPFGYPTYNLDDMVVYTAPDGATSTVPDASDQEQATPPPPEVVPAVSVPDGAVVLGQSDFEDVDLSSRQRIVVGPGGATANWGDFTFSIGSRNDANGATAAEVLNGTSNSEPNKYVQLLEGPFASAARGPKIKLVDAPAIGADEVYHETFALKLNAATDTTAPAIYFIDGDDTVNNDKDNRYMYVLAAVTTGEATNPSLMTNGGTVTIPANQWVTVDFELQSSGQYNIYIDGELAYEHTYTSDKGVYRIQYNNSGDYQITPNKLPSIVVAWDKADSPTNGTVANIDNLVAYKTGDSIDVPGPGETQAPTPSPAPEVDAPVLKVPATATVEGASINFNANEIAKWYEKNGEAQEIKDIEGMTIKIGSRSTETSTYAAVSKYANGNVFELQAGKFSNLANGAIVSFDNELDITDTGNTTVLAMAVMLKDANSKLYMLADDAMSDNSGYIHPMAVLVGDGTGSTIHRGGNADNGVIGVDLTPGKWHVVAALVSGDKYRVFVDGEQVVAETTTGTGNASKQPNKVPMLVAYNGKNDPGSSNPSNVKIDNILTYQGVLGERAKELLPTIADVWTKYEATYADGVLTGVKMTPNVDPTVETADPANGVYIWNQNLKPYVAE